MSPTSHASSRNVRATGARYTLVFSFPGHANRREGIMKRLLRRDSVGGLNLNTGSNVQCWLPAESARDPDFFGPVSSFPTRCYILQTGTYRITYGVNILSSGTLGGSIKTFISRNGAGNVLVGSMGGIYIGPTSGIQASCSASFLNDCTGGDYLEIYAIRVGALTGIMTTIQGGVTMQLEVVSHTAESLLGGKQVVQVPSQIERVTVTKGVSGYSGTTSIRLLKNGLSVMGSNDMLITSAQQFAEFGQSYFATSTAEVGDVFSLDVISEEAPYPRDLCVIVRLAAING